MACLLSPSGSSDPGRAATGGLHRVRLPAWLRSSPDPRGRSGPAGGHRRPGARRPGRGFVHEVIHQVIHSRRGTGEPVARHAGGTTRRPSRAGRRGAAGAGAARRTGSSRGVPGRTRRGTGAVDALPSLAPPDPEPGASPIRQRPSEPSSSPSTGSSASRRQPSRSTQSAREATAAEAAMTIDVSSMQPRKVRKPSSRARASISRAGPGTPALGELHVHPRHDPDEGIEILDEDRALVGDDRDRRGPLELGQPVEAAGREGLLDDLDPELDEAGQERPGHLGRPAGVRVHPERPGVDAPHRLEGRQIRRPADLDLQGLEVGRPASPLGDDGSARRGRG
ncbi:MAG: hypothetical protein KatS3mg065_0764 [Chloroflexota bacterium]|nr:MAG: hypothetical protein KatS3mg065_0764 [Chloroflexota bacterium]